MLYNRKLDGVNYDQWKKSSPPQRDDESEVCEYCDRVFKECQCEGEEDEEGELE